ncbi:hypothetical protein [Haliangium ochraceum]|uniref:N-acetyltransferase domain-containing protein n=1 Tax=Haliangium ochraceum (strain DSM 14365 / JCM 11303 / SMP-2) TaxID=502025 RepID=D0LSN6_HALO1|nr:hypothetical protein [Haliangium ochraceum]ACY17258.1 conserved hypothetical protein [Haliangium ochraceum DSM 14365]
MDLKPRTNPEPSPISQPAAKPARPLRVRANPAERADSAALARFYGSIPMRGELELAVEREPDFFALYDLEHASEDQIVWVARRSDELLGVAGFLARDCHLGGARTRCLYLTDLRARAKSKASALIARDYGHYLEDALARTGAEAAYTVVFDSNREAVRALVERHPRFPQRPLYSPLRRFSIRSVQFAHRAIPGRRLLRRSRYRVRRAEAGDLDYLVSSLVAQQRARPLGYAFEDGLLERRLQRWPGFALDSFYLVEDRRGNRLGFAAPWDAHACKRYRVLAYRGGMQRLKRFYDPLARCLGGRPLPPPGGLLPYFYLTHLCIPDDDPAVLAAIVDRVYADYAASDYCFFTLYIEPGTPMTRALRGYLTTGLDATLYEVTPAGRPTAIAGHPTLAHSPLGFEMALA